MPHERDSTGAIIGRQYTASMPSHMGLMAADVAKLQVDFQAAMNGARYLQYRSKMRLQEHLDAEGIEWWHLSTEAVEALQGLITKLGEPNADEAAPKPLDAIRPERCLWPGKTHEQLHAESCGLERSGPSEEPIAYG